MQRVREKGDAAARADAGFQFRAVVVGSSKTAAAITAGMRPPHLSDVTFVNRSGFNRRCCGPASGARRAAWRCSMPEAPPGGFKNFPRGAGPRPRPPLLSAPAPHANFAGLIGAGWMKEELRRMSADAKGRGLCAPDLSVTARGL